MMMMMSGDVDCLPSEEIRCVYAMMDGWVSECDRSRSHHQPDADSQHSENTSPADETASHNNTNRIIIKLKQFQHFFYFTIQFPAY